MPPYNLGLFPSTDSTSKYNLGVPALKDFTSDLEHTES